MVQVAESGLGHTLPARLGQGREAAQPALLPVSPEPLQDLPLLRRIPPGGPWRLGLWLLLKQRCPLPGQWEIHHLIGQPVLQQEQAVQDG